MKRPRCKYCKKPMSPRGGAIDGSINFWVCWDCEYEITDNNTPLNLTTKGVNK
jgi:hypothetical protein